ncbi:hypothetical protein H0H81_003729 [Sphagnurus paluster]|uniref:Uncharacterized protein n=1 Tax=Sphagnurus paluster TaxID=117069 RepID=A0A9P7FSA1_9AGAR|nr:hypothetical protein H0H81_003729 [Sphagnurus paluster]
MSRHTQRAVAVQIELDDALSNVERWKRTQTSQQFTRATPATRKMLDDQRAAYVHQVSELKRRLNSVIKYLSEIPNSDQSKTLPPQFDRTELMGYNTQLRDWVTALRLLDCTSPPNPSILQDAKDPKELVWNQIQASLDQIDAHSELINEELYSRRLAPIDVEKKMAVLRKDYDAKKRTELASFETSERGLLGEADQLGKEVGEVKNDAAALLKTVNQNALDLQQLKAELEKTEKEKAEQRDGQLQGYIEQLQACKGKDEAQIQVLIEKVQSLHRILRPPPRPLTAEDLVPAMKELIIDDIYAEINELVHRLVEVFSTSREIFFVELWKEVVPILEATQNVCRRAEDHFTLRHLQQKP